jgi:hypothetical protein
VPPVVVTGRHRPHEVTLLVFCALLGVAFVAGARPPGSVEEAIPSWLRWTWYLLLLVSGTAGLVSLLLRDVYLALVMERGAMFGQAAAFTVYALAIFALGGWQGLAAGGLCAALATASVWRFRQVSRDIRLVRRTGDA